MEKNLKIPEIINYKLSDKNKSDLEILLPKMRIFKKSSIYDMIFDSGIDVLMGKYQDGN